MSEIKYVIGDATQPEGRGKRIIAHVCNDQGKWGAGFVLALSQRGATPEMAYRAWFMGKGDEWYVPKFPPALGRVQLVPFIASEPELYVANMIAQHAFGEEGKRPIRYTALATCLNKISIIAREMDASVHMPRIGCGLAGGSWQDVSVLVQRFLVEHGVPVTVYDLPNDN
jgi:O-acetyl-ADP-ribose deacetylase (regulator of RNase III)